ncbi:hypothetical protein H696_00805 [Fonticula alba]|uniref:Uncharacterized protein n=1 Tax=Fonticula alba TaxID=691883 RepID=A0A058ZH48_FONAL|nr:hypothetical protein H696_00805 [Fonticula alba]KCV73263.1 hypothetical protein H696_00805 [Fonticula alba]|eukprot:XP_009492964.1 hypothetical protein H696_00805 [Fonticula alba]
MTASGSASGRSSGSGGRPTLGTNFFPSLNTVAEYLTGAVLLGLQQVRACFDNTTTGPDAQKPGCLFRFPAMPLASPGSRSVGQALTPQEAAHMRLYLGPGWDTGRWPAHLVDALGLVVFRLLEALLGVETNIVLDAPPTATPTAKPPAPSASDSPLVPLFGQVFDQLSIALMSPSPEREQHSPGVEALQHLPNGLVTHLVDQLLSALACLEYSSFYGSLMVASGTQRPVDPTVPSGFLRCHLSGLLYVSRAVSLLLTIWLTRQPRLSILLQESFLAHRQQGKEGKQAERHQKRLPAGRSATPGEASSPSGMESPPLPPAIADLVQFFHGWTDKIQAELGAVGSMGSALTPTPTPTPTPPPPPSPSPSSPLSSSSSLLLSSSSSSSRMGDSSSTPPARGGASPATGDLPSGEDLGPPAAELLAGGALSEEDPLTSRFSRLFCHVQLSLDELMMLPMAATAAAATPSTVRVSAPQVASAVHHAVATRYFRHQRDLVPAIELLFHNPATDGHRKLAESLGIAWAPALGLGGGPTWSVFFPPSSSCPLGRPHFIRLGLSPTMAACLERAPSVFHSLRKTCLALHDFLWMPLLNPYSKIASLNNILMSLVDEVNTLTAAEAQPPPLLATQRPVDAPTLESFFQLNHGVLSPDLVGLVAMALLLTLLSKEHLVTLSHSSNPFLHIDFCRSFCLSPLVFPPLSSTSLGELLLERNDQAGLRFVDLSRTEFDLPSAEILTYFVLSTSIAERCSAEQVAELRREGDTFLRRLSLEPDRIAHRAASSDQLARPGVSTPPGSISPAQETIQEFQQALYSPASFVLALLEAALGRLLAE